jgi:hypothetical protein
MSESNLQVMYCLTAGSLLDYTPENREKSETFFTQRGQKI